MLKPFYEGNETRRPFGKNKLLQSREALMAYVADFGTDSIIIQRMIQGGDGFIFDTYGYSDRTGQILTMASHRRLRQNPINFGSTSFGEIPSQLSVEAERSIFAATERHHLPGRICRIPIVESTANINRAVGWCVRRDTRNTNGQL